MTRLNVKMGTIIMVILALDVHFCSGQKEQGDHLRELHAVMNPGCPPSICVSNRSASPLLLSSFTAGLSTHALWTTATSWPLAISLSKLGFEQNRDEIHVDWEKLMFAKDNQHAITFSSQPLYSAALSFFELLELDAEANVVASYPLHNFKWSQKLLENDTDTLVLQLIGANYTNKEESEHFVKNGFLNITVSAYSSRGLGAWLPHLSHSARANQVDLQLQNLQTSANTPKARMGLRLLVLSTGDEGANSTGFFQTTRTLDDEHTPGVFYTQELLLPGLNSSLSSFLQWRPVVYTSAERDLSSSTSVQVFKPRKLSLKASQLLNQSFIYAQFGMELDQMFVREIVIMLGKNDDDASIYAKTNYAAWTVTLGLGRPVHNGLSELVLLFSLILAAAVLLLAALALVLCACKRFRGNNASYRSL